MTRPAPFVICVIAALGLTACSSNPPAARIEVSVAPLEAAKPSRPDPIKLYDEPWQACGKRVCLTPEQANRSLENRVELRGFGAFSVKNRPSRSGRNPRTGAAIQIKAAKVPKFRPGKALKDALN